MDKRGQAPAPWLAESAAVRSVPAGAGWSTYDQTHLAPAKTFRPVAISLLVYALGVALLSWAGEGESQETLLVALHVIAAGSLFSYWWLASWGSARYDCFGAALLIFSIVFQLVAAVDTLTYGTRFDSWPPSLPTNSNLWAYVLPGEAISHVGLIATVAAWRVAVKGQFSRLGVFDARIANDRSVPLIYALAVFVGFAGQITAASYGGLAQFLSVTYFLGVASIYFLAVNVPGAARSAATAALLGLPLSIIGAGSGMKEEIFLPLVPAGILSWRACKGVASRTILIGCALCVFAVAQLFVGYTRSTAWADQKQLSVTELSSGFLREASLDNFSDGLDDFMSRINPTLSHALTVAIADRDGFLPGEIFGGIPSSFIPRILWPEKPVYQPGASHTARILGLEVDLSEITTATAPGFFTELYLGGGMVAVLVGAVLFGYLQGRLQMRVLRAGPAFAIGSMNFWLFYSTLRFDEKHVGYAFTSMAIFYLVLNFIFWVLGMLSITKKSAR